MDLLKFNKPKTHQDAWDKGFRRFVEPFEEFVAKETTSSIILMMVTVVALIIANSPLADAYHNILHMQVGVAWGDWLGTLSIHHIINDGLMALFFFVVGLEIKREVLTGELSHMSQAMLPIIAAIGGMVFPALFFAGINFGTDTIGGWGIPMATDIAFAVGILAMLGSRVPRALLTFLVALAIVDDLGAVVVIALFYTEQIYLLPLFTAFALIGLLYGMNRVGIRANGPYLFFGFLMWIALLQSGVHATLAGIFTAWTLPTKSLIDWDDFRNTAGQIMQRLDKCFAGQGEVAGVSKSEVEENRRSVMHEMSTGVEMVKNPSIHIEHAMHKPVAFFILPLFALANAGIAIDLETMSSSLSEPLTLGIIAGLLLGKFVGITGLSLLAVKLGIAEMPTGTNAKHLVGVGLLGGIGFTMSIFIAELGLVGNPEHILMAKTGILVASIAAGLGGYLWLRMFTSVEDGK